MDSLLVYLARDIQYKNISWELLILLHLDDIANLKLTPCFGEENLLFLGEDDFINWFRVDLFSCCFQLSIVDNVQDQVYDKTQRCNNVNPLVKSISIVFVTYFNQCDLYSDQKMVESEDCLKQQP